MGINLVLATYAAGNTSTMNTSTTTQSSKTASDNTTALFSLIGTTIAASLAAGGVIFTAISNRNQNIELAKINAKLATQKSEEDALRDYRFDALRRMYNEFELISFAFNEACDNAMRRILLLAKNAREGNIGRFQENRGFLAPIKEKHKGRYLNETTYLLLAPMAYFKIFQKKLTSVDLQLDKNISFLFQASKDLYYTLQADDDLANSKPLLTYEPNSTKMYEDPAKHSVQGLNIIALDTISEYLIYNGDKVITLPTFLDRFGEEWKNEPAENPKDLRYFISILLRFHPADKPVFWRILLTQLCLYKAIKKIGNLREAKIAQLEDKNEGRQATENVYTSIGNMYKLFEGMYRQSDRIDWGQGHIKPELLLDKNPVEAVKNYLIEVRLAGEED